MADFAAGTRWSEGLERIRPVLESEIARGNRGGLTHPELRDSRQAWSFRYPLDIAALDAQFEFGDGVRVSGDPTTPGEPTTPGRIEFRGLSGAPSFVIAGSARRLSLLARRRRVAWWAAWRAHPQPRLLIENPWSDVNA